LVVTVQLQDGIFNEFEGNKMKKQMLDMPIFATIYKDGR